MAAVEFVVWIVVAVVKIDIDGIGLDCFVEIAGSFVELMFCIALRLVLCAYCREVPPPFVVGEHLASGLDFFLLNIVSVCYGIGWKV